MLVLFLQNVQMLPWGKCWGEWTDPALVFPHPSRAGTITGNDSGGTLDHGKGGWVHIGWDPFIFIQELMRSDRFVSWMFKMPWRGPHIFLLSWTSSVIGLLLFAVVCSPVTAACGLGWD